MLWFNQHHLKTIIKYIVDHYTCRLILYYYVLLTGQCRNCQNIYIFPGSQIDFVVPFYAGEKYLTNSTRRRVLLVNMAHLHVFYTLLFHSAEVLLSDSNRWKCARNILTFDVVFSVKCQSYNIMCNNSSCFTNFIH